MLSIHIYMVLTCGGSVGYQKWSVGAMACAVDTHHQLDALYGIIKHQDKKEERNPPSLIHSVAFCRNFGHREKVGKGKSITDLVNIILSQKGLSYILSPNPTYQTDGAQNKIVLKGYVNVSFDLHHLPFVQFIQHVLIIFYFLFLLYKLFLFILFINDKKLILKNHNYLKSMDGYLKKCF